MLQAGASKQTIPLGNNCVCNYRKHYKRAKQKPRKVVDYRKINATVPYNVYPLPKINALLDSLQGAKDFGALNLI